jgi:hypothetical protein
MDLTLQIGRVREESAMNCLLHTTIDNFLRNHAFHVGIGYSRPS